MALGFWTLDFPPETKAAVDEADRALTYGDLRDGADRFAESLDRSRKSLGFVLCRNTPDSLAAYLGALRSGHAVCLLDGDIEAVLLERLLESYVPDWMYATGPKDLADYCEQKLQAGYFYSRRAPSEAVIDPELAVLLPTSGSTGSPKLVRLSYRNLQANAASIVEYLGITSGERCITSLPMAYSYGLSVLNTHLLAGAQILMTNGGFLQREFWTFFRKYRPTTLSGVPYHYEMSLRMRMLEQDLPELRTLTQAGGRLSPERIAQVAAICRDRALRFFVMYGQTEATARIAYVPAERLQHKVGTIGIPIPGGSLSIDQATHELLYAGPNVMLGYADGRADLAKGDELCGRLRTGDLARCDEDGYYFLTGRMKRFLKIFGKRFSLDEMESLVSRYAGSQVACFGVDDRVCIAMDAGSELAAAQALSGVLHLHSSAFRIVKLDILPRLPNGKLDYQSLTKAAG